MKAKHLRPTPGATRATRALVVPVALVTALTASAPAFAGKGGGAKPSGTSGSSSLRLVLVNSTDGLPHYGQDVRFDVSTTQTSEPHVRLSCSQGGSVVLTAQTGYYASYPWPSSQTMTLASGAWTGGAADCTATLYWFNGSKTVTGATLGFHVYD
jgi:hypothetical protein